MLLKATQGTQYTNKIIIIFQILSIKTFVYIFSDITLITTKFCTYQDSWALCYVQNLVVIRSVLFEQ